MLESKFKEQMGEAFLRLVDKGITCQKCGGHLDYCITAEKLTAGPCHKCLRDAHQDGYEMGREGDDD